MMDRPYGLFQRTKSASPALKLIRAIYDVCTGLCPGAPVVMQVIILVASRAFLHKYRDLK